MKKEQFRTMVKEIIKEIINEMESTDSPDVSEPDDTNVDLSDVPAPTSKTDKRWRGKMRFLDKIKNEPDFQDKLHKLRQSKGDEPFTHKTSYK